MYKRSFYFPTKYFTRTVQRVNIWQGPHGPTSLLPASSNQVNVAATAVASDELLDHITNLKARLSICNPEGQTGPFLVMKHQMTYPE